MALKIELSRGSLEGIALTWSVVLTTVWSCQCHATDRRVALDGVIFPSPNEELRYREPSSNYGWSGRTGRRDDPRYMNTSTLIILHHG
jgi:hypothetical protein